MGKWRELKFKFNTLRCFHKDVFWERYLFYDMIIILSTAGGLLAGHELSLVL